MINSIRNEYLSISIKDHGAELCSVKSLKNNKEYLWQADPQYWGKHAPILFPFIGASKDNQYIFEGKTYDMTKHGFARDLDFKLIEKDEVKAVYQLLYNDQTLEKYPLKFELLVIYELMGGILNIEYKVINRDNKKMYFSIGAHPAFNCNIEEGNAYLEFENKETLDSYVINLENGLIKNERRFIQKDSNKLFLDYELFNQDALVFDSNELNSIAIREQGSEEKIKVTFKGFPYLGIWTPCAPFICIEPWYGIADTEDASKKLEDKLGVQTLGIHETFKCSHQIEIIN